jgi:hypothetical protein
VNRADAGSLVWTGRAESPPPGLKIARTLPKTNLQSNRANGWIPVDF